jgi:hypothetical protein
MVKIEAGTKVLALFSAQEHSLRNNLVGALR